MFVVGEGRDGEGGTPWTPNYMAANTCFLDAIDTYYELTNFECLLLLPRSLLRTTLPPRIPLPLPPRIPLPLPPRIPLPLPPLIPLPLPPRIPLPLPPRIPLPLPPRIPLLLDVEAGVRGSVSRVVRSRERGGKSRHSKFVNS